MEESKALVDERAEEEEQTASEEASGPDVSMETLLEEEGLGIDFPKAGETRTGVIASISPTEILVSVGAKSEGVIAGKELEQIDREDRKNFEVGQEIPVFVLSPEDKNGNLVLSYNRAREEMDWELAEKLLESKDTYEGSIAGYNKGGLIVPIGRLRGFVPASQVSLLRRLETKGDTPEQRWGKMVGEEITVQVIEVDRSRRRLILSERAALQETRESLKERLLEELNEGDIRDGRVTSLADFGAFVNIEGADGLVHLSEVSWERIQHPNEVLKVGQEVKVKVISIDRENKRIGLSIRQLLEDPWSKKVDHLKEGLLIEGTITHLTKFGAFARLGDEDLEGLIHISELSERRIEHPKEVVSENDTLTLRIIKIDRERHRIGLSLRKVDSPAYADLDWKMLRDEIETAASPTEEAIEAEAVLEGEEEPVAEAEVEEAPEAEEEPVTETEVEAEVEEAPEAEEEPVAEVEAEVEEAPEAEEEPVAEVEAEIEEAPEAEEEPVAEAEVEETPEAEEDTAAEAVVEAEVEAEAEEEAAAEAVVEAEVEESPEAEEETPVEAEVEETPEAEEDTAAEAEAEAEVEEAPEAEEEAPPEEDEDTEAPPAPEEAPEED